MRNAFWATTIAVLSLGLASCGGQATAVPSDAEAPPPDLGEPFSSETPADVADTTDLGGRTIVVGTDATYPPFESTTEEGEIVGIDPSLMAAICEIANCVAKFQNTAWDGIFGALRSGEFDVLMSAITILPEREGDSGGLFTEPYFQVGQVLLAPAGSDRITGLESLSVPETRIGVQTGTTGDTAASELSGVDEASIARFETIVLAVQALLNGDVDVVVLDNPTADVYVAQHAGELAVVGEPFTTEDYGILVPAEDTHVLAAFNAAIEQLHAEGAIDQIVSEWYAKESAPESSDGG
jgi:polar amino acid transport system substrate-binding protein